MWNKPPNILWHSLPREIHVSLGSAEASWERRVQMPHLYSTSGQLCESEQRQQPNVSSNGKFNACNACVIYNIITLHNIVDELHVSLLWLLHLSRLWESDSYFCFVFDVSQTNLIQHRECELENSVCAVKQKGLM